MSDRVTQQNVLTLPEEAFVFRISLSTFRCLRHFQFEQHSSVNEEHLETDMCIMTRGSIAPKSCFLSVRIESGTSGYVPFRQVWYCFEDVVNDVLWCCCRVSRC